MKSIKSLFVAATFVVFGSMSAEAATVVSTVSVAPEIRKIIILQDDGTRLERFERCDKETGIWLESKLDSKSGRWVLTPTGEAAREARMVYLRELDQRRRQQARFERGHE